MTKNFSIYLDIIRFSAAFLVLLFHSQGIYPIDNVLMKCGLESVIAFFVLSGYVIAYVAETKEKTMRVFLLSRAARIYSVAIPAVIFTLIIDLIYQTTASQQIGSHIVAWDHPLVRIFSSLLFLNHIWTIAIQLGSNIAYWSLNYEVWYYVFFALLTYVGGRKGWILFVLTGLLVGHKILMLMPIWWLGAYIYKSKTLSNIKESTALVILLLSISGMYIYFHYDLRILGRDFVAQIIGKENAWELVASKDFLTDYLFGIVFAANIVGMRGICERFSWFFLKVEKPIRYVARTTFTLYLLHQPLVRLYPTFFADGKMTAELYTTILAMILLTVWIISRFTEEKKQPLRQFLDKLLTACENKTRTLFGSWRGLVRTVLSDLMWRLGPQRKYGVIDWNRVRRMVFVCQGNICRSPFGYYCAKDQVEGIQVTSMGLATTSGEPAYAVSIKVAKQFSIDLSDHITTDLSDFEIRDGDLYLVMEDRHIRRINPAIQGADVQVALLGLWCRPRFALLYDPFSLSNLYFATCFDRIKRSVDNLLSEAKKSGMDVRIS